VAVSGLLKTGFLLELKVIGEIKQEIKRVNVPDLRDLIEFWEMKEEFISLLVEWGNISNIHLVDELRKKNFKLFDKIESIGKKGSNGK